VKVVFLGTPDFAIPSLEALDGSSHEIALVVTQPDRPKGRGRKVEPPPVKLRATELGLRVEQPRKISTDDGIRLIQSCGAEAGVVCAFGEILTKKFLESTPRGFFNVHASLLPKYRGAAPVPHAILAGDEKTGATIQKVVTDVDAGDIISRVETGIAIEDTTGSLLRRLSVLGANALVEALDAVESGEAVYIEQDGSAATCAPKITNENAMIDWNKNAAYLQRFVRAMSPSPGAFTTFMRGEKKTRLIIGASKVAEGSGSAGTLLEAKEKLVVAAGRDEALQILQVKPEGKRMMEAGEFLRGYRLKQGYRFV